MLDKFVHILRSSLKKTPEETILCAVSGGMDSMCLLELMRTCKQNIAVAHVNYGLRNSESDKDELLVKTYCTQHSIPFHRKKMQLDTKTAVQEQARNLRYSWFEQLSSLYNYSSIATAHHLDDQIETMMINLIRGTGLKGLTGIPEQRDNIIRPLLSFSRTEIQNYVLDNNIPFRHDRSNDSDIYLRNRIRHHLTDFFYQENPNFSSTFSNTIRRLKAASQYIEDRKTIWKSRYFLSDHKAQITIDLDAIPPLHRELICFSLLEDFGFNQVQVNNILQAHTGRMTQTENYSLLKDRKLLILRKRISKGDDIDLIKITKDDKYIFIDECNTLLIQHSTSANISDNPLYECLDAHKITFPLVLRSWKEGDRFQPLGMGGKHQKLQDFLTHIKLHRFQKEKIRILEDTKGIIWVIGHRISERVKIQENTTNFIHLQYIKT